MKQTALEELCLWIAREAEDLVPVGQDLLDFATSQLDPSRKRQALAALEDILARNPSDQELEAIWFRNGARVGVVDISVYRIWLDELRRRLKGEPPRFHF